MNKKFKIDREEFEAARDNELDIYVGDIFLLDYCGIKVFFQVAATLPNEVYVYELATKKYNKDYIMLTERLKPSKTPYFVLEDNLYSKTNYKLKTVNIDGILCVEVPVDYGCKLFCEAEQYEPCPQTGTFFAYKLEQYYNLYWEGPKKREEERIGLA